MSEDQAALPLYAARDSFTTEAAAYFNEVYMKKNIPGFLALISAISTSAVLAESGLDTALTLSLATAFLLAASIRFQAVLDKARAARNPSPELEPLKRRTLGLEAELSELQERLNQSEAKAQSQSSQDATVLMLLRMLQEKARILDFAMTDISRLPDPQVGAAARVVHGGLRSLIQESFEISPIASQMEGQNLSLPENYDSHRYRLLHQAAGQQKPEGQILHRGWELKTMHLPKTSSKANELLPAVLAPVEIETSGVGL